MSLFSSYFLLLQNLRSFSVYSASSLLGVLFLLHFTTTPQVAQHLFQARADTDD